MAKPSPDPAPATRLLVLELWGLGDLALALPFVDAATRHAHVTVLAKPHAAALLRRFAPAAEHIPFVAPWTAFDRKYALWRWPWASLAAAVRRLRRSRFDIGVSARPDPRDHLLLALGRARRRIGFARAGSGVLLTDRVAPPADPHRAAHWRVIAATLGWSLDAPSSGAARETQRRIVIHTGAARAVRQWPRDRFEVIASRLRQAGWDVDLVDDTVTSVDHLISRLDAADRFIGNDSGPGHIAALLGKPTFTIFGPQLPELFAPQHPAAAWIEGAPCKYKPCFDRCRFAAPLCLLENDVEAVWQRITPWLANEPR